MRAKGEGRETKKEAVAVVQGHRGLGSARMLKIAETGVL